MKISEAMDKTGLTKRAIRYYEDEGLIKPSICSGNSYRDYSSNDVEKLVKISLFRQIDLSINDIKELIDDPSQFSDILKNHVKKIEENISRLQASKTLIEEVVENNSISDPEKFVWKLKELRDCIDNESRMNTGYIEKQLGRIFPGPYGKLIRVHFSPFLNETIDSKEKEEAWKEIVKYFDETDSISYPDEFDEIYENFSEDDIIKMSENVNERIKRIINSSEEELGVYKSQLIDMIKKAQGNSEFVEYHSKIQRMSISMREQMAESGYYERFLKNMRILSRDYNKYMSIMNRLNEELGLKYDENGSIISDKGLLSDVE